MFSRPLAHAAKKAVGNTALTGFAGGLFYMSFQRDAKRIDEFEKENPGKTLERQFQHAPGVGWYYTHNKIEKPAESNRNKNSM